MDLTSFYQSYALAPMHVLGMPLVGLAIVTMGFFRLLQHLLSYPMVYTLVNTTSVFLKNTQEVWGPLYNTSLSLLKPFAALKPINDLGLVLVELSVRSMIILGYVTVLTVREAGKYTVDVVNMTRAAGISLSTTVGNAFMATKDFTGAVFTLVRGFSYLTVNLVKSAGYVVNSFEVVSNFLYQSLFTPNTITWADIYNISFPFAIVASILTYVFWRSYNVLFKPYMSRKREQVQVPQLSAAEDLNVLRRSSRIARKRALLLSHDLQPFSGEKTSSPLPPNL